MATRTKSGFQLFIAGLLLVTASLVLLGPAWSVASDTASGGYTPEADPMAPITVGPRDRVGKVSTTKKAAAGVVGGVLGGVLGSSGGKSSKSAGPKTERDPTRKQDYAAIKKEGGKLEAGARAQFSDDGLLVSTGIEDAPDKGTFQTVFLQSCDGQRLYPQRYEIYKLWTEQSLSVSWSKTSTTNGQVTGHENGGWNDAWSKDFGNMTVPAGEGLPEMPATWQQLGFDHAQGGARELGAYFNISPQQLAEMGEVALFVHTTRPGLDPVTTEPFNWLLAADAKGQARITPPDSKSAGAATTWQNWSDHCEVVSPVLLAAAGGTAAAVLAASDAPVRGHTISPGLPLPAGIQVITAKGTGRTTGHIATLSVQNDTGKPIELPLGPLFIPSTGPYQSYVVPKGKAVTIAANSTQTVPVQGFCVDIHRPPVPAGEPMPPVSDWIAPGSSDKPITVPPRAGAAPPGRALIPGTGGEIGRTVDPDLEPEVAVPLLLTAIEEIERAAAKLQESGELQTPFSGNPERERESVIQQTFWLYAAELTGEEYTKEGFTQRLEAQHEQRTGVPITAAPREDWEKLQQGADDFWDAFELVGVEAKVIRDPQVSNDTVKDPVPVPGTVEVVTGCDPKETVDHTPKTVDVIIDDSYGDEESRKQITEGIRKSVESGEEAYTTDTPPATAYSIWGHDHIGGIAFAYAKSVFSEVSGEDWVWSTDPMTTEAKGTGTHTLAFKPGPDCKAVVAGSAMMWIKASSDAFDPMERSIEMFRALDKVKEVSVKYAARRLPPGIKEAVEAGVDVITDPASNTYAAASGSATLTVGDKVDTQTAANRVVYKRIDKEDKAIVGGGETIKTLFASDVKPNSLTSKLDATARMEGGASGNGFANAYLESLYGTILVGVCECPNSTEVKILTDHGQLIRGQYSSVAVERAMREMQEAADRIAKAIEDGDLEPTGDNLKKKAEEELKKWGESQGGEKFKPKEVNAN